MADVLKAVRRFPVIRFVLFLVLWSILIGASAIDLVVGAGAALAGALASLALLPELGTLPPGGTALHALRFLRQSLLAGLDVARRVFDPALPLNRGFVLFRSSLRPGLARDFATTLSGMMPGTLPADSEGRDGIVVHCLDLGQPVLATLAEDESRLRQLITGGQRHG